MAKRFTDTSKWAKESFSKLPLKMKLSWIYLCDNCNHAGVWDVNMSLMSFQIGEKITMEELKKNFGEKIIFFQNKLFLPSFFYFQYGQAKDTLRAKISAQEILKTLGFMSEDGEIKSNLNIPRESLDSPGESLDNPSISISIGISKKEGSGEKTKSDSTELVEFWNSQDWTLPKVSKLTKERQDKLRLRLKEASLEDWRQAVLRIHKSDFLLGKTSSWKADFDWLITNEGNRLKIVEGKYDNQQSGSTDWSKVFGPKGA